MSTDLIIVLFLFVRRKKDCLVLEIYFVVSVNLLEIIVLKFLHCKCDKYKGWNLKNISMYSSGQDLHHGALYHNNLRDLFMHWNQTLFKKIIIECAAIMFVFLSKKCSKLFIQVKYIYRYESI